ncbi:hypothetical protein BN134_3677 [Cronobacter dublinensis 1210]|uniref:Uncharacterized protein n=1 Tax=Cronobacter dublinensis 1210 TaxID=1208656 RepID=A0ABP1WBI0_9ENTR|nr:hypothetical protein BN134_3677 [Cronobacter dublinensis 1210]CCJ83719.1 hypothetical protein BN133_96 [Cronobacter dublinensis 582]
MRHEAARAGRHAHHDSEKMGKLPKNQVFLLSKTAALWLQ